MVGYSFRNSPVHLFWGSESVGTEYHGRILAPASSCISFQPGGGGRRPRTEHLWHPSRRSESLAPAVGGSTLGGRCPGTGASGPDSLTARLSPPGLGSERGGPGGGGACVVRGSIGNC